MRIGLIGLGRIGAFHAGTLSALPSVTSLVVTDAVAGGHPRGRRRAVRRRGRRHAREAAGRRASTAWSWPRPPTPTRSSSSPRSRPGCRCSARSRWRRPWPRASRSPAGSPARACPSRSATRAASTRASPPSAQAIASGELGWVHTVRSTTLDPAPPPAAYLAVSGGIFRDCSIHDFDAVRWVTGREVVEVYATGVGPRRPGLRRPRRRGLRRDRAHPRRRRPRGGVEQPLQRPWPRRAHGGARLGGQHRRRPGRRTAAALGAAGRDLPRRHAVHVLHGPLRGRLPGVARRRSPRWSRAPGPRRARSRTRWRRAGWPRPPRCRSPSTVRSASTRCANRCPDGVRRSCAGRSRLQRRGGAPAAPPGRCTRRCEPALPIAPTR